ncbi:cytochrome P450 [Xylogone sp. PMI_703]|nr:cytochrome P450 [Xylogone sp. PMI_703]
MNSEPRVIFLLPIAFMVFVIFTRRMFTFDHDPQEPPVARPSIPYIGHIVGIARQGMMYYKTISQRSYLPIYTMYMANYKQYVVTEPELVTAVQRNSKKISFNPFMASWLQPLLNISESDIDVVKQNMDCEEGNFGYMKDSYDIHHDLLSPGPHLDKLREAAMFRLACILGNMDVQPLSTGLYAWIQHLFTDMNTYAMWGPQNPFVTSSDMEKDFWLVETQSHLLLLNLLPRYTSSGAYQARERMCISFREFYSSNGFANSSDLVKQRIEVGEKWGMSMEALARMDIGLSQALLVNSIPVVFWLILRIFSNPELLEEIKMEVQTLLIQENGNPQSPKSISFDLSAVGEKCPLLMATWQEVLRSSAYLPSGRTVIEDVVIGGHLLKKGTTIIIPTGVIHSDSKHWGASVDEFRPHRFLKNGGADYSRKRHPSSFRPFGGGASLCPGRHFALQEGLVFAATLVIAFEIEGDGGNWNLPPMDAAIPSLGGFKPAFDPKVNIKRREGFEKLIFSHGITSSF